MEKDIFDRIMEFPGLRRLEPFYRRNKEVLLYLFFGGISFFLNIFLFFLLTNTAGIHPLVANIISWIGCVLFQFFTNRTWVFDGKVETKVDFWRQMLSFFGGRLFTLLVEEIMLATLITWLNFNAVAVKLIAQVVVIVLNYVISKLFVFKN